MAATLEGLRAGEDPEQLRTRLAEFTATLETATRENGALETGAEETARDAAAELDAATEAVDLARAAAEVARAGAEAAWPGRPLPTPICSGRPKGCRRS